jgi:methionyl-tRNA formyltransferase
MDGRRLLFLGSKRAGLLALNHLLKRLPEGCVQAILCPDDRADVRSEYENFRSLACQHGLPLHLVESVKDASSMMRRYQPHTALVHGWYKMIPVTEFPATEFVGFHYSPLPRYRGNAPMVWQIINGEHQLGVSFFVLDKGMDEGDLIDQRLFELAAHEDISDALDKANQLVVTMLDDFLPRWLKGSVVRRPQPLEPASYCGMRTPEDGHINWSSAASTLHNFIRAQSHPYPGAYSRMPDGRVVRFWKAEMEHRTFNGVPGSVVDVGSDAITVACGVGALRILRAELEGESEAAAGILRSIRVRFG